VADDEKDLAAVAPRERSDDESLVAAPSHGRYEPFLLQAVQGTAHRGSTEAHPCHDRAFGDAGTGGKLSGHDQRAELLIHARNVVAAGTTRAVLRRRARRAGRR
jgi:hypothetical protein